jgi:hypothetical protein
MIVPPVLLISISLFLLKFTQHRRYAYILYFIVASSVLLAIAGTILFFIQCDPVSYFWHQANFEAEGSCSGTSVTVSGLCVTTALTGVKDVIILILPVFIIRHLHMSRDKKIMSSILLGIGGLYVSSVWVLCQYSRTMLICK